ncbi:TetR family transcriptional regulator [Rhodococcus sp. NPDC127528]|uniref:TetR family transcriptional regulator n=1 Tax=unclassified Rhodococcus (in: high G+C Gram-positive bacteria) TaxID=192944 RepID=UPI00362FACE4
MPDDSDRFRLRVVSEALRLFSEKGYEATSVDEIAEAAGISRRTFFRQFRSKEDVVFADHEILLAQASEFLAADHDDPWDAVCDAAMLVFERFSHWRDVARRRYAVVHGVPALRDREIVTVFRYERLFVEYLRGRMPETPDLALVQFAALVTATHNYVLRRMVRDESAPTSQDLREVLAEVRASFRDNAPARPRTEDDVVVAVFARGTAPHRVAELIERRLNGDH